MNTGAGKARTPPDVDPALERDVLHQFLLAHEDELRRWVASVAHTGSPARGLALFGMLLVHFHQRTRTEATGVEDLIGWVVYVGVEQKAWGTFAFLFGVGFAVLFRRLEARGAAVVPFYLRRLAVLAVFGIISEVFFGFHILFAYAC